MQEEKPSESNKLDESAHLLLGAIHAVLEVLHGDGFEEATMVDEKVSALVELPGGDVHLLDIFTVLSDAIKTRERTCVEQHLAALVDMLNESIAETQTMGALCEAVLGNSGHASSVAQPTEPAPPSTSGTPSILLSACHWMGH